ncbi:cbl-associated protein isoform 17-T20 [Cochliomyia hominivorax]
MPNYRNKNRNRNKNKQRNKQQQQQQQQQQQKQQPQKEKQEAEICKTKPEEASTASTALTSTPTTTNNKSSNPPTTPSNSLPPAAAHSPEVTNATAVCCSENNVKNIVDTSAANEKTSNELINVTENAAVSTISTNTNTSTTTTVSTTDNDNDNVKTVEETSIETNDTVLNEPSAIECDNRNKLNHAVNINDKMGNEKSKIIDHEKVESFEQSVQLPQQHQQLEETVNKPSSCVLGKVIVHRIVCEDSNSVLINKGEQNNSSPKPPLKDNKDQLPKVIKEETEAGNTENVTKVIEHKLITSKESENQQDFHHERVTSKQLKDIIESGTTEIAENNSQKENLAKVIIHQVQITPESKEYNNEVVKLQISEEKAQKVTECPPNETQQQTQAKVIVHKVELQHEDSPPNIVQQHEVKVIVHKVQTPEEEEEEEEETPAIANPTVSQHQAKVIVHQIHLEEKDEEPKICSPTLKEPIKGKAKPSTSDVRIVEISDESLSDLEELKSPVVSEAESSTECADEIQKVAESITEVSSSTCSSSSSSSSSSTTSSQKQSRKQKRIALEHHFLPQMLNPRFLDSISEENNLQKTNATPQSAQATDVINSSVGVSAAADPKKLRLLCAETLASFPYGDAVLEELATVAQNIGEARAVKAVKSDNNMPYPLPELPHIDDLQLSLKVGKDKDAPERPAPPQQGDSWLGVQTNNDPKVLVCLSPSQRSYIQQKPEQKPDDLLDAHQKFVERRGYHEYTKEQLQNMEREKLAEQQLLQTAAMMKKLRKSITPPPPQIPPPPVPVKSSETASKAQNLSKRTVTTTTTTNSTLTHTQKPNDDANLANDKEQISANTKTNGENNGEENKHRLLSIIQDTSTDSNANRQQTHSVPHFSSSSSFENNSRQTTNTHSAPVKEQVQSTNSTTFSNGTSNTSYQFPQLYENKGSGNMQSVETTLGQMFPNMGSSNIFDQEHKRFSNIESSISEPFCSQILNTQPKRYSSIETHSYETQKRIENGKVVQDFSTSKHETKTSGDKPDEINSFPLKTSLSQETNSFLRSGNEHDISKTTTTTNNNNNNNNTDDQEIMSALNLNNHSSDRKQQEHQQQTATKSETIIKTTTTETSQNNAANDENKNTKNTDENDQNRIETKQATETNNAKLKSGIQDTYEEFRQRAKAAADAASTLPTLNLAATTATVAPSTTEKVTSNGDNSGETISSTTTTTTEQRKATLSHDHEKLFKEFDELSKQLHRELETSKAEREQREKSASMFDLNRVHMRQKQQIEEFNKTRHEHLKELEKEIDRSMRSRSLRFNRPPPPPPSASSDTVDHQSGRVYQIPIQIENGNTTIHPPPPPPTSQVGDSKSGNNYEEAPPVPEPPRTYQIPIQIENSHNSYVDDGRFRRAESMFNLSDDMHRRQRTYSTQSQYQRAEDDWSKYASDLGSSENIARPFAKEVEICYQRRPGGIRAPRLTASTNDLSFNNQHSYDQYNAYNVRRHHAPMLNRAPEQSRPQFGSCYSMIERDPNPKYISTTTRRGVSPAPQSSGYFPLESVHVREEDMRQRRASLPREIHEQQLKYIASKEEELRTEFQRLQAERRRLMEEAQRAQTMQQVPQTPPSPQTPTSPMTRTIREHYRSTQKLPTLTEDEVFRQQMAEEWLSKVAEREKRRLQNIIKISKITEDQEAATKHKANMEEEFLSRVKERRHKLAMPADSDWESGAESQPTHQAQLSETEDVPPVKIIEGEQEANLRRLPRHLREFAKFSNHQKENIEGGHREEHQEEERSEETTDNSVSRAVKKSSVIKTVKTLRAPMLPENGGHDTKLHYHKTSNHYQIPLRPRDPQRRTNKQTRFAVNSNRRSWSESDLLQEIDKDLKLAKGFLFQDEKAQSPNMFAPKFKAKAPTGTGIWSPKSQTPTSSWSNLSEFNKSTPPTPPPPPSQPVWTPQASPQSNRKEFRPVHFESPTLPRKYVISTSAEPALPPWNYPDHKENEQHLPQSCTNLSTPTSLASDTTSAPSYAGSSNSVTTGLPKSGIAEKIKTFERSASASELYSRPQIKRLADKGRPLCKPNEVIYKVKHEYMSEPETENEHPKKMAQLGRRQYDGIGPITNDGMPIILRSEVKEPHQHEWYKRLYQTIHKQKHGEDCVIRYKQPRGRTQYSKPNGYQSEPEPNYDSDYSTIKYRTVNPNRLQSVSSALNVRKSNDTLYGTLPNPVKSGQNSYKNQPGRIEDYVTGHSSVSEKEKKEWWDEIMDIFNVQLDQAKLSSHYTEGNLSRALAKESGYTSDSNLVFRKKEIPQSSPLSPVEQKQAYKNVQAGGEPPLFGFRKPAPEKSKDYDFPTPQLPPPPKGELLEQRAVSPNRYYESDVNIHFKTPVRQEFKYPLSEEELAIRQAEQMQKLYQEERRRKYLQELQDMNSRRHTDNFTPSQKSPIALNRYDDFPADLAPKVSNQVKSVARALYNFQAQNSKELSFKKGDIIYIKRAIDKNWYEGEHNAMIGLFPANYVEIINKDSLYPAPASTNVYRKPSEGQARAKYNFQAQSGVELSLNKGELVALTRRVDDNWFEGRIANRKGIFPVSYVEVLTDIGAEDIAARTTTTQQQSSMINVRPSLDALRTNINNEFNTITRNGNQPPNAILRETRNAHKTDILHVDTTSEPLVYRALYKYRPQNSDELELQEGDIVHVLEKCDDGWYVGTSQRTGCFGTFPGNYVERV